MINLESYEREKGEVYKGKEIFKILKEKSVNSILIFANLYHKNNNR